MIDGRHLLKHALHVATLALSVGIASTTMAPAFEGRSSSRAPVDWYTGANQGAVDDSWKVAVDTSVTVTSNSSAFGSLTLTAAPIGPATVSGVRVRLEGVAGTYSYPGAAVASRVTGYQEEASALAGYELVWRDATLSGFVGVNVRGKQLSIPDPGNPLVGTGVGLKVAGSFYARPTDRTMVAAIGSYSTRFDAYNTRFRAGYMIADQVYIGPEALFLGDTFFRQYRIGAHLSGVTFGPVQMGVSAGYVEDRRQGSGYYSSIEARALF